MSETVIQYVLRRLHDIGIDHIFGVAGDFAFPVQDAIAADPNIKWMGACNELNAGFSADGYARVKGIGAMSTTYGPGELGGISAVAGAYAAHLPIFHLTGMPAHATQRERRIVHHTLANGEYEQFRRMAEPVVCASAIMTPQNAAAETERLIASALYYRRPVYMAFPTDFADKPILGSAQPIPQPTSDASSLADAVDAISDMVDNADSACILAGLVAARAGLRTQLQALVDASGLPYTTMFGDKTVLDEQQSAYIGMYDGHVMDEQVREFLEETCDVVLAVGAIMSDFNTGAFTANLDPARTIEINLHEVQVGPKVYPSVEMGELLQALAARLKPKTSGAPFGPGSLGKVTGEGDDPITADTLYPRWGEFIQPNDIVFCETGTASMGLVFERMPRGSTFHNQTLWGAIGWATPASYGAAVAAPSQRVVLITGEGSHQLTAQEISQFGRNGLKPVVFVLNNNGYLIERLLCNDPAIEYNDLAQWNYAELPHALGCNDWYTARVSTCGELDEAIKKAGEGGRGAYVEIVTDTYAAPPLPQKLHDNRATLYA